MHQVLRDMSIVLDFRHTVSVYELTVCSFVCQRRKAKRRPTHGRPGTAVCAGRAEVMVQSAGERPPGVPQALPGSPRGCAMSSAGTPLRQTGLHSRTGGPGSMTGTPTFSRLPQEPPPGGRCAPESSTPETNKQRLVHSAETPLLVVESTSRPALLAEALRWCACA